MRLPQQTLSRPMTSHRGIGFLLSAVLLAGFSARGNAQYATVITYPGSYSAAPTKPPAKRATASPVAVRLSEWKLELSQLTVPTGEIEITVKNGGTMPHALEIEGQGIEKELEPISAGATSKLRLNLPPGSYELYCPIGDGAHEKMGMIAHIEVIGSVNLEQLVTDMKKHRSASSRQHRGAACSERKRSRRRETCRRFIPRAWDSARESLFQRIQPGDGDGAAREREIADHDSGSN